MLRPVRNYRSLHEASISLVMKSIGLDYAASSKHGAVELHECTPARLFTPANPSDGVVAMRIYAVLFPGRHESYKKVIKLFDCISSLLALSTSQHCSLSVFGDCSIQSSVSSITVFALSCILRLQFTITGSFRPAIPFLEAPFVILFVMHSALYLVGLFACINSTPFFPSCYPRSNNSLHSVRCSSLRQPNGSASIRYTIHHQCMQIRL